MSKITKSLLAKVVAIFLFVISGIVLTTGIVSMVYLVEEDFYSNAQVSFSGSYWEGNISNRYRNKAVYDYFMLNQQTSQEERFQWDPLRYERRFHPDSTNFRFLILSKDGELVLSNCTEAEFREQVSYVYQSPIYEYISVDAEGTKIYDFSMTVELNYYQNYDSLFIDKIEPLEANEYTIYYGMCNPIVVADDYYIPYNLFSILFQLRYWIVAISIAALFLLIVSFVFLMCAAGHRKGYDEVRPNVQDRIPLDFYFVVVSGIVMAVLAVFTEILRSSESLLVIYASVFAATAVCLTLLIAVMMSIANRLKLGSVFRNTILYIVLRLCWRIIKTIVEWIREVCRSIPVIWKQLLWFVGISLCNVVFSLAAFDGDSGIGVLLWFVLHVVVFVVICIRGVSMSQLENGAKNIAEGNKQYRIQSVNMYGHYRDFAENLNHIGDGIEKAVNEQVKSERMKAELITNVSHDIKTPLTSIINYVDLLKKENIENPSANEYIEILDRQSARLKKLTEDLVEASKASTGNLAVEIKPTDVVELLNQSIAEYSERLSKTGLTTVINIMEEHAVIPADGRLLWRVFDNLLSNVCKYSQENTRVYFDVTSPSQDKISVTVKNISREVLNISATELMERFVRGDSARHTEGSGLGLSIAESLTQLQGGQFELVVDGDLFKAKVTFPRIKQESAKTAEQQAAEVEKQVTAERQTVVVTEQAAEVQRLEAAAMYRAAEQAAVQDVYKTTEQPAVQESDE